MTPLLILAKRVNLDCKGHGQGAWIGSPLSLGHSWAGPGLEKSLAPSRRRSEAGGVQGSLAWTL